MSDTEARDQLAQIISERDARDGAHGGDNHKASRDCPQCRAKFGDTTPRDQLAQIIAKHIDCDVWGSKMDCGMDYPSPDYTQFGRTEHLADAIVNAGWHPPARVVSTWEEVQSLKEGALLAIERWGHMRVYERQEDDAWCLSGGGWLDEDWLPATVLWEPEEAE